jgi:hypothetical protein
MTILERFGAVKNKELRGKLRKNYNECFARSYGIAFDEYHTDRDALTYGFSWAQSSEGGEYWRGLSELLLTDGTFDRAFTVMMRGVPDMPSIPPPPPKGPPKGKEYRYCTSKNNIIVQQFVDNKMVWKATFTIPNFIAWAKENT